MDDRQAAAWLHRRAGFGLHPDQLTRAAERGPAAELERLVDPDGAGIADPGDPWDGCPRPRAHSEPRPTRSTA